MRRACRHASWWLYRNATKQAALSLPVPKSRSKSKHPLWLRSGHASQTGPVCRLDFRPDFPCSVARYMEKRGGIFFVGGGGWLWAKMGGFCCWWCSPVGRPTTMTTKRTTAMGAHAVVSSLTEGDTLGMNEVQHTGRYVGTSK